MVNCSSIEAQDALYIILNHSGKHDHQVLHKLLEFMKLDHCWH